MLDLLKNVSFYVTTLSKVVTSATENSLMPLIQMAIVFPSILYFFPKDTNLESALICNLNLSENSTEVDITECLQNRELKAFKDFSLTVISITISFLSMASTLTMTYFSKPGRSTYATWTKKVIYFLGIILQVVPKILGGYLNS